MKIRFVELIGLLESIQSDKSMATFREKCKFNGGKNGIHFSLARKSITKNPHWQKGCHCKYEVVGNDLPG